MSNKVLFKSYIGRMLPKTDCVNEAGGQAYAFKAEHALAQYAATGCLNGTFYASAEMQLATVLELCEKCSPAFIAKTALYVRRVCFMKDMPALLCAVLSVRAPKLLEQIFDRVIDDAKMVRNFVQIMRSGVVGRKSLGSLPKRLVRNWIECQSVERLFTASVGNDPSLVDIVRMVHPRPQTQERKAFFDYLLGKEYDIDLLPEIVKEFEVYKKALCNGETPQSLPNVPFQMLTSERLTPYEWIQIARNASWQTTRMNLNTFVRNGVFGEVAKKAVKPLTPFDLKDVFAGLNPPKKPERQERPESQLQKSIFNGCNNPTVVAFFQEEMRKEEEKWQSQEQDYLRKLDIYNMEMQRRKENIQAEIARLEEKRRERMEQEEEKRRPMRQREREQRHLLDAAREEILLVLAERLQNPKLIARSKVFPYQLMTAFMNTENVPAEIRNALEEAMEIATANVPVIEGKVFVFPDLSGSMWSPITGHRHGSTSKVKCVDVAALVASAILRKNPTAKVVPFGTDVTLIELNPCDSIMTNAAKLSSVCAGGTNCSAPLQYLNDISSEGDLVVYLSDNESWVDSRRSSYGVTKTMVLWSIFRKRNPNARMICIDLQPYGSTQAQERLDIINVGGFSDEVFNLIANVAAGASEDHWIRQIGEESLDAV